MPHVARVPRYERQSIMQAMVQVLLAMATSTFTGKQSAEQFGKIVVRCST
ncbi:MAG: hypothetical protein J5I53_00770 [Bradyrhizobiaceae bacterium]|nr:hypothetical protein [Bradyrhizobiaceae bacterium]